MVRKSVELKKIIKRKYLPPPLLFKENSDIVLSKRCSRLCFFLNLNHSFVDLPDIPLSK